MSMIHEPSHLWPKSRQFANDSSPLFLRSPIFLKKTSHLRLTSQNVHHTFIVYIRSLILRRGLEREHGRRNSFLDIFASPSFPAGRVALATAALEPPPGHASRLVPSCPASPR